MVTASRDDGIYVNLQKNLEVDIDEEFKVVTIQEIIYDLEDRKFYILTNHHNDKLGFFLIRFDERDPYKCEFLIKWQNKLDVDDANVFIMRDAKRKLKELVVSYKTIYVNTMNLVVLDISKTSSVNMIFRHESF